VKKRFHFNHESTRMNTESPRARSRAGVAARSAEYTDWCLEFDVYLVFGVWCLVFLLLRG
jgi:hypothetical protein